MTLPLKPPFKLSQVKAECLGDSSMRSCAVKLGMAKLVGSDLQPDIKATQFLGKNYGNLIFTPANKQSLSWGVVTGAGGYGSIQRNTVGGNFTGFVNLAFMGNQIFLTLNNFKQGSWSMYVRNNGHTYTFTKSASANIYTVSGAAGTELGNLIKANVGKQVACIVTPH
ncbi:hypothetical protein [Lelliottia wanjuensis]|uniref:hypothetical protein n=1 Tax=Lelliottia wanjuensis TaxID=3050585 RepID=UPI00254A00FD|nr:hypothetical protein [Lelliottia sp. V86_10]MDK9585879.1 hypothetical protein [Lelliottia sp. V86_10]